MHNAQELIIGLVMLLTTVGTIAAFITFYRDEGRTPQRVKCHKRAPRRRPH